MMLLSSEMQTCRYCDNRSFIGFYFCPYCGLNQDGAIEYSQEEIDRAKLIATKNFLKSLEGYGITIPALNVVFPDHLSSPLSKFFSDGEKGK